MTATPTCLSLCSHSCAPTIHSPQVTMGISQTPTSEHNIPLLNKPFNGLCCPTIKSLSQLYPLLLSIPVTVPRMPHVSVPLLLLKFLPELPFMFLLALQTLLPLPRALPLGQALLWMLLMLVSSAYSPKTATGFQLEVPNGSYS